MKSIGWNIVDQILSSSSAMLVLILVTRETSPATLGVVAILLLIQGFVLGLYRAGFGDALVIATRGSSHGGSAQHLLGRFIGMSMTVGTVACLLMLAFFLAFPHTASHAGLVIALGLPPLLVLDTVRYWFLSWNRGRSAALLDGIWLVTMVAILMFVLAMGSPLDENRILWANLIGSVVASITAAVSVWPIHTPRFRGLLPTRRSLALIGEYLIGSGFVQLMFVLVGAILSLGELGYLRLSLSMVAPVVSVLAVLRVVWLGSIASRDSNMTDILGRSYFVSIGFGVTVIIFGALVYLGSDDIVPAVFGDAGSELGGLLVLAGLAEGIRVTSLPFADIVRAHGSAQLIIRSRAVVTAFVSLALVVGAAWDAAYTVLVALILAQSVCLLIYLMVGRRLIMRNLSFCNGAKGKG